LKDFDRTDYWAPESDLDSELPEVVYTTQDGSTVAVRVNDWLDLDTSVLPEDPLWGSSFQVVELLEEQIVVRCYDASTDLYQPICISPALIFNNYRRVPKNV